MRLHVVRQGETLSVISQRYRVSWRELARINGLRDPDRLHVGQRLYLPGRPEPRTPMSVLADPSRLLLIPGELLESLGAAMRRVLPDQAPTAARSGTAVEDARAPEPQAAAAGEVTAEQIRAIMPNAGARVATYLGPINTAMRAHNIHAPEQRAAFLAQISAETGQLRTVVENLNYSAGRLAQVWPGRFRDPATARRYANDPEALANYVYSDRLGNGDAASGDGWRYRGRGLMQVTGRYNYRRAGFENNPEQLGEPMIAADTAARYWSSHGLNERTTTELARGPFTAVSRVVNSANMGGDERWAAYQRGLAALRPAEH